MKTQLKASEYSLSVNNVKKIIYAAKNFRDRVIIETLYYQGMRRMEITTLRIEHIHFQERYMDIYGKFNKVRSIPLMSDEWVSDIQHLVKGRTTGHVFLSSHNRPVSIPLINYLVAKTGFRSGVNNPHPARNRINPHIFRHSIARHLKDMGYQAEFIQKFLGHSSIKTTMDEYGTLSLEQMKQIQQKKMGLLE